MMAEIFERHQFHRLSEDIDHVPSDEQLYIGSCQCGARWQGESICHCATCHLTFTSINGFNAHRTGSHGHDTRRCRTEAEIRAIGYEPNERGQWRRPMDDSQKY